MKLVELDRFLLGDNPFTGVSHLSQERSRERSLGLDVARIVNIVDVAFKSGAQGLAFTTHPVMYEVLDAMRERPHGPQFGIYPLIPDTPSYARLASEKGTSGLVSETLIRLGAVGGIKTVVKGALSALQFNVYEMMNTFVDAEIQKLLRVAPSEAELKGVFLHELVCDTALAFRHKDFLQEYIDHICRKYSVRAGLVTRNFAELACFFKESDIDLDRVAVMTPFNKLGFQMTPRREDCELALDQVEGIKVIAMSTMAAGYLRVSDALEYLKTQPKLHGFVVGASTPEQARETFRVFREELG